MQDWVPALSSSGVVAIIGFIWGTYYKAAIEKGIEHRLNAKLEASKSEYRKEEEAYKQALKHKDDQIVALRSGALSALATRSAALDKRKLEAIENVWASASDYTPLKTAATMAQNLHLRQIIDRSELGKPGSQDVREFVARICEACKIESVQPQKLPTRERPFVSPLTWALHSAHATILATTAIDLLAARAGVGLSIMRDSKELLDSVKAVIPTFSAFMDEHGRDALPHLVEPLEEALLSELRREISGADSDGAMVEKAARILKAVDDMMPPSVP
ncbi:hypothetical protein J5275_08150 [Rhizobium sp. L245/93]|nr:hypothetical protein [Rhizobium sp. L245/93]